MLESAQAVNDFRSQVLLVEDDSDNARIIREALEGKGKSSFRVQWVTRLSDALERLNKEDIEVVLLHLAPSGGQGTEAFDQVHQAAPHALILDLSAVSDDESARQAARRGAQNYLSKDQAGSYWLPSALSYAIERKAAEEALFEERERAQVTLDSIGDAVVATDIQGYVTYLNRVAERLTGWGREDAMGRPLAEVFKIIDGATRRPAANPGQRAIEENGTVELAANSVLVRRDGFECAIEDSAAPIHGRDGRVAGAVIIFHDVSQSRATARKMTYLAQHDFLTGLPNRVLLTERLSQAIGQANRHRKQVALLFLDLDNFKHINDSLGHAIGDQLLRSVTQRLSACVRTTDTVCRQGGDEFVILLTEIEKRRDAAHVAKKLHAILARPHFIGGHELHVTVSAGISVYPDDGHDADTVMHNADTAMYHAKAGGGNTHQFFRANMKAGAVRRLAVDRGLRHALKREEFLLHYQPQIDRASGAMTRAEALIRWRDPGHGLLYPAQFVPVAEECGLIVPIGQWVMREACAQVRSWLDAGLPAVPVAVNISAVEFRHKRFLESVARILKETGLAPGYLELEITEGILMHDAQSSASLLKALKAMGVRLAIDDFGTGYSSLSYLKRFPMDTLKIDQSFMQDIASDTPGATIVGAVIAMGRKLKQRVVAEGVETPDQLAFLQKEQCGEGQGFQFSHPLPAEDFKRLFGTAQAAAMVDA
ncbi:MAG: EAL domain-containing protein [Burkholderiales bacterium]